uniref:Mgte intracellular region n=1 Tax=wastewater metagenome TaxID=527639 RepID=A0A0A8KWP6_9ZZZZ
MGAKLCDANDNVFGKVIDIFVRFNVPRSDENEPIRPRVEGFKVKSNGRVHSVKFSKLLFVNAEDSYRIGCEHVTGATFEPSAEGFFLGETILDKQIVDLSGRKLVRVNDIRLVALSGGAFAIAVDVGVEGLLRRIGIIQPTKAIMSLFKARVSSKFILWDDVEAVDFSNLNIKLSKTLSKLSTLHPSDLADIIEDLGKPTKTTVFSALDEEKAADVLEELEPHEQVHILENIPVEKAADVLELMPADEVADIMDELEETKAEELLQEMEREVSEEVRELLEYSDSVVGSLMTTNILSFKGNLTVGEALKEIRQLKPEIDVLYNVFVTDNENRLLTAISLRDLVISEFHTPLADIMTRAPISVYDDDPVDSLAEIVSKYNLLAVPVTDHDEKLCGMVVVDDIVEDLIGEGRTK